MYPWLDDRLDDLPRPLRVTLGVVILAMAFAWGAWCATRLARVHATAPWLSYLLLVASGLVTCSLARDGARAVGLVSYPRPIDHFVGLSDAQRSAPAFRAYEEMIASQKSRHERRSPASWLLGAALVGGSIGGVGYVEGDWTFVPILGPVLVDLIASAWRSHAVRRESGAASTTV